jgi:hypothetical protein
MMTCLSRVRLSSSLSSTSSRSHAEYISCRVLGLEHACSPPCGALFIKLRRATERPAFKQSDLLFTIDKRPFQNTLDQAQANLELAKSNLVFTQSDLARGQQLMRDRTISEQIFEQRSQAYRNAQAAVAANEAMVRPSPVPRSNSF